MLGSDIFRHPLLDLLGHNEIPDLLLSNEKQFHLDCHINQLKEEQKYPENK